MQATETPSQQRVPTYLERNMSLGAYENMETKMQNFEEKV